MFRESVLTTWTVVFQVKRFFRSQKSVKISWYSEIWNTRSWDTFAFLGRFPIHTGLTPPLTTQTMLDTCIPNFFGFQLCIGWGKGDCKKFSKRMHRFKREPRNDRKYEYCSTVPRTFVQDCSVVTGMSVIYLIRSCYNQFLRILQPRLDHLLV